MITYFFGNQLSRLAGRLSVSLKENLPDDLLKPQTIIVPNRDTAKWLQLYLSGKMGIAANLDFLLPAEWHWKRIREIYPGLPKTLPSDPEPMKWTLCGILSNPQTLAGFPRLHHYISVQSEEMREMATLNLSRQLASVYDQYLIYRPEMILKWDSGNHGSGDEKWQAELWNILTDRWRSEFSKPVGLHKAKLFQHAEKAYNKISNEEQEALFLFNPGLIPASVLRLLKVYSETAPVFLFQNRPSRSVGQRYNCTLLNALGDESEGVEGLYGPIVDEAEQVYDPFEESSLLGIIQNRISDDLPDLPAGPGVDTSSIHIRSCHSPLREVETLHQFLLEQFEANSGLKPKDILVVTPDLTRYEEYIEAVFGTSEEGVPGIPYRTPKTGYHPSMQFKNCFLGLLNLLTTRFTYDDVIDLFLSKPVLEGLGIGEEDGAGIRRWLDDNYVIWGIDRAHRAEWDQPEQDTHTWKRALDRLWLGDLLGPAKEGGPGLDRYSGVRSITDRNRLAAFSTYFNLLTECRNAVRTPMKAAEWFDLFEQWASELFSEAQLTRGDGGILLSTIEALREQFNAVAGDSVLPFRLIRSEMVKSLQESHGTSARFTDGVTFSTMVPVRGLPFKVIALIGLSEESFPRKQSAPDFDLVAQSPRVHERDRKKEDKALFLESILSAGEIHYCSYIGQDRMDNERRPPSPIVSAWTGYLGRLTGGEAEEWIRHEALSGFSPDSFRNSGLYSETYFQAMRSIVESGREQPGGLLLPDAQTIENSDRETDLADLIRFYTKHTDWFLRRNFDARIRDQYEDREEFTLGALEKHMVFRQIFSWKLKGAGVDEIREVVLQSGIVPEGWAGVKECNSLLSSAEAVLEILREAETNPELFFIDISNHLNGKYLTGTVESYSKERLVQVNPSTMGGKNLFKAWLNHLAFLAAHNGMPEESWLIGETKKDSPKTFRFKRVENAGSVLSELLEPYINCGLKPMKFFPDTVYTFLSADPGKSEQKAISSARRKFEGDRFNLYAERDRLPVKLLYGPGVEFSEVFLDKSYLNWMSVMNQHMEEV